MKLLLPVFLLTLLLLPATASAGQCEDLLEWEVVFSLAHDELVDYQTDESMERGMRIKACDIYLSRIEKFIEDYPAYCDTQNSVNDLTEMKENVVYIRDHLKEQDGSSGGHSRY